MNLPNKCEIEWQPVHKGFQIKWKLKTTKKCTVQVSILHPDQAILCHRQD